MSQIIGFCVEIDGDGAHIVVATKGDVEDWAAYKDYSDSGAFSYQEILRVADYGFKIPEENAATRFPTLAKRYTYRR